MKTNNVKSFTFLMVILTALSSAWTVRASDDPELDRLADNYFRARGLDAEDKAWNEYVTYMKRKRANQSDVNLNQALGLPETGNARVDTATAIFISRIFGNVNDQAINTFTRGAFLPGPVNKLVTSLPDAYLPNPTSGFSYDPYRWERGVSDVRLSGIPGVVGQMYSLDDYTATVTDEIGGMMSSAVKDAARLRLDNQEDSEMAWILESRRYVIELREQAQQLPLIGSGSTAPPLKPARPADWLDPNDPFARAKQVEAGRRKPPQSSQVATRASTTSQAAKWQKLNAAMDAYEQEKNAPTTRANEGFTPESEKQSYDSVLRAVNAENEQQELQVQAQQTKVAELQGQVDDLKERIANKAAAIEQMKKKMGELKARANDANAARERTQAENQQLQQEIAQTEASIEAEEASVAAMQSQQDSSLSTLNTILGGLSLAGNLSKTMNSMSSGSSRSQVASDTASYSSGSYGGSGSSRGTSSVATRGSADDGAAQAIAAERAASARAQAWAANQQQQRYGSSSINSKIYEYRKNAGK